MHYDCSIKNGIDSFLSVSPAVFVLSRNWMLISR